MTSIRRNGVAFVGEVGEAAPHANLVALEDPGITLDRLHQRARLALLGGAALAVARAAQTAAQLVDGFGRGAKLCLAR